MVRHGVSIDVEDYRQILSVRFRNEPGPVSKTFERDMGEVITILDNTETKATFFVTGTVAKERPELLRRWAALGHEMASHGYSHTPIWAMTAKELKDELEYCKRTIEDAIGQPITGYRAPIFSVRWDTLWALDVIRQCGFTYDSSIVPVRMRRYGIGGFDPEPRNYALPSGGEIVEVPLAIARVCGKCVPVGGGGYFRLFSSRRIRRAVASSARRGAPFVMYCHPDEFGRQRVSSVDLTRGLRDRVKSHLISLKTNMGRRKVPKVVRRILGEFHFSTLGQLADKARAGGTTKLS